MKKKYIWFILALVLCLSETLCINIFFAIEAGIAMDEFDMKEVKIIRKQECDLDEIDRSSLREILNECFPDCFSDRIFHKQLPTMRFIAFYKKQLVGQVGIDHRVISVDRHFHHIFGIVDLCVTRTFSRKGIGALLITNLENLAIKCGVNHVMAFADKHELYNKLGYKNVKANCKFLAIEDLSSHSLIERDESKILLIKS